MASITAVELGADTCAFARTSVRREEVHLSAAEILDPSTFPGMEAFTVAIRSTRRSLRLPRRCRAVVWGVPDGASRKDAAIKPLLEPLTAAGFRVERVVSPCNALAALARLKTSRGEGSTCWLAINRGGVAIVVVRPGKQLYAHSFAWDSSIGASGSQARLLQRYSLVSFLSPEVKRAMAEARKFGTPVDAVVTCGNLPDLRSLTMPLIEELDVEVETLDSLEGLVVTPQAAEKLAELAPAIRLACAAAIARGTRPWDESKRRSRSRSRGAGAYAKAAVLAAAVVGIAYQSYVKARPSAPLVPAVSVPAPAPRSNPPVVSVPAKRPESNPPVVSVPAPAPESNPKRPESNPPAVSVPAPAVSVPAKKPESNPKRPESNPPVVSVPAKRPESNPPAVSVPAPAVSVPAKKPESNPKKPELNPATTTNTVPRTPVQPLVTVPGPNTPRPLMPTPSAASVPAPVVSAPARPRAPNPAVSVPPPISKSNSPAVSVPAKTPESNPPAVSAPPAPRTNPPAVIAPPRAEAPSSAALNPGALPADKPGAGSTSISSSVRSPQAGVAVRAPLPGGTGLARGPMAALLRDAVPRVTAILVSRDRRYATLDGGQIIGIGDLLGRRTVVGMDERSVVLQEPSGVQIRVGLGGRVLGVARGVR